MGGRRCSKCTERVFIFENPLCVLNKVCFFLFILDDLAKANGCLLFLPSAKA
jgi:hypothetical protein